MNPFAILAVVLLAAAGVQTVRLSSAHADVAEVRAQLSAERMKHAIEREDATEAALMQAEDYRAQEQDWRAAIEGARHEADTIRLDADRRVAAVAADRDRLRQSIADYAAGRRSAEGAAASCDERATKLGLVLDDALRTSAALADGAERVAADARLLLRSWPVERVRLGQQ